MEVPEETLTQLVMEVVWACMEKGPVAPQALALRGAFSTETQHTVEEESQSIGVGPNLAPAASCGVPRAAIPTMLDLIARADTHGGTHGRASSSCMDQDASPIRGSDSCAELPSEAPKMCKGCKTTGCLMCRRGVP